MLFEVRNSVPEVSARWQEARDRFLAGQVRPAWDLAQGLRRPGSLETANDYLLNIEIARACGAHRTYLSLVRLAQRAFPGEVFVQLYHARALLTRGMHTGGIAYLLGCEDSLGRTHRGWWATQLANMYADAGFEASCLRWLETAAGEPEFDSPLGLYTRACAFEGLRRWEEATELTRACIAVAGQWTRARSLLVHCLLTQGRLEEAQAEIDQARELGHEDASLEITAAMLAFSLGRFDPAREMFERFLARWPQADGLAWVKRTLCILLVELGRWDAARELAGGEEAKLGLPPIAEAAAGKPHRFLPLPLVAQNKNQCVPTSVAMAAWPQGRHLEPNRLFREMHGSEGTALWQMRHWVHRHGFRLIPVRLEKEALVGLLDLGIPLIGVIEGAFHSHVDVVCGYHEGLQVLYVRDPVHWAPIAYPWELAFSRYELHGALLAVIDDQRPEAIQLAERWQSSQCDSLLDLAQAVAAGDLAAAERAFAAIPDDSCVAFLRDAFACDVAVTPARFREDMQRLARDENANPVARFRALLGLDSEAALEVLKQLLEQERERLGRAGIRYLRLMRAMHDGQWGQARELIQQLLVRGGSIADFWSLNSDIQAELGDQAGSEESLRLAIELQPRRMNFREKVLNRTAARLTLTQYLEEFETLLREDPDDKRLLWGRAMALAEGPDGKVYEQAALDYLRWFPRDPRGYFSLLHWYRLQERQDLIERLLAVARQRLPDVFPPAPADDPASEPATGSPPAAVASEGTAEVPAEAAENGGQAQLPDDKSQLLDLAWTPAEARRGAAVQRLIQLEQEKQLDWSERASLLANRLLAWADSEEPAAETLPGLLPLPTPGAPHWFTNTVADLLSDHEPSIRVALAVCEWLERAVPDFRNYVGLWFNRVLLFEKARRMERAFEELQQLLDRYPAYSSALYRMGVVKYRQEDYGSAVRFFERALEVNPGLLGAMNALRSVQEVLDDRAQVLRCIRMLRRKLPYDFPTLRDEVLAVAAEPSPAAAEAILDAAREDFCPRRLDVLRARLELDHDRIDQARRSLAGISIGPEDEDGLYEDYLQARLGLALRDEDRPAILQLCEEGLRRWPNSTRLKEIQAEHLAAVDLGRSRQLLRDVLCQGEPRSHTALQYLQLMKDQPDEAARHVVFEADPPRREMLVELFAEVFSHHSLLRWNAAFLEWALQQFPDSDLVRWRLIMHYNISGRASRAVELAEELHRRNPDHPEAARMLGRCLIDQDPQRALPFLEQVCQQNRSADYLFDLARCYQLIGDRAKAEQMHWETLQQNPYLSASWTNLFVFGGHQDRLWPFVEPMLEHGCGLDDEYFLVAVVELALQLRRTVPVRWFPAAVRRYQILQTHPGFRDERVRLQRALLVWARVRPGDVPSASDVPSGFFPSLLARFVWPRRAWIPRG